MAVDIDGINSIVSTDKLIPQSGTALQIGESGDTVSLASGATAVNFGGGAGSVKKVSMIQTRTIDTFSAPISGDGSEIVPLTLTVTPSASGNAMILEYNVNGEMNYNTVYIVTRNGVRLPDSTNTSNNRWAGITAHPSDTSTSSTPDNAVIKIVDFNTLATSSVYKLHVRASSSTARTLYLNRTSASAGGDNYETSLSTLVAMEIEQ